MIQIEKINNVARLTFNRPDKFNAFVREMALDLQDKLGRCQYDDTVRCILLTGNGKAFCAGQDLEEVSEKNKVDLDRIVKEHFNPIILKITSIAKPVIAAVNGVAAGAGANIALACDIIVASESASFIQAFSKIGLIPDSGGTYFLPRLIGWQKASALMMTGDKVSAKEAEKLGMIYKVFSNDKFNNESMELAHMLSEMPTKGLALTKKLLNCSVNNNLKTQLELENSYQAEAGKTFDYKEGVQSFLEKRKPVFKGK